MLYNLGFVQYLTCDPTIDIDFIYFVRNYNVTGGYVFEFLQHPENFQNFVDVGQDILIFFVLQFYQKVVRLSIT